jgi:hypothetical protein
MSRKKLDYDCPWIINDRLIPDHVGGTFRKEWLIKGSAVLDGAGQATVTISDLTGGLVTEFDDYWILAQKITTAPAIVPRAEFKTSRNFVLRGDANATFLIIIMGYEFIRKQTGKWAYQYCPYCKDLKFKAVIGSAFPQKVAVSFSSTCNGAGAGVGVLERATQQTGREVDPDTGQITYRAEGVNQKPYGLKMMTDTDYSIFIAPVQAPGTAPYPTLIAQTGFTVNGGANLKYDVLVFGKIEQ